MTRSGDVKVRAGSRSGRTKASHVALADQVYGLTSQIPSGRVTTYGTIAKKLGKSGASRAVGRILAANPRPIVVPCHRVVASDGRLGGYSAPGGTARKKELLLSEGVEVRQDVVELSRFLFSF